MLRYLTKIPGFRRVWSKLGTGSVVRRTEYDAWNRPAYAYGIYSSAVLAQRLRMPSLSVIEFGVAGGDGLVNMEHIAELVADELGIEIKVYGFDTGTGMPPPLDYRDLPYVWGEGFYNMDVAKLRARLKSAEVILGDVARTIPEFLGRDGVAPMGFLSFDLDYYSSTKAAFQIFEGPEATRLPRVYCYFDDVISPERACHNEFTGELRAIGEYNDENDRRKIAKFSNLAWLRRNPRRWNEQIYVHHDFYHPLYNQMITPDGAAHREKLLT